MELNNKNILITGGSQGIGSALVHAFLQKGAANVVIFDLIEYKALTSDKITYRKVDVCDAEQVRNSFREVIARLEHLDIVIANAGMFNELEPQKTVQVNLLGVMNTCYSAIEFMCKTKGGHGGVVLTTASIFGLDTAYSMPSYVATKHAVIAFTRCLSNDYYLQKHGIKFITFCPGFTDTTMAGEIATKLVTKDSTELDFLCSNMGMQSPEALAESVVNIINEENGSIWMISNGVTTKVVPTTYWKHF